MNAPANQQDTNILFPPGRIVQGDLYDPQTKDMQGNDLVTKTGDNAGKTRVNYFFAVAIPKTPGATHWAHEPWGAKIWALGHAWWPQGQAQSPGFAWKIEDGDDTVPNKNGRKNSETEGFPGCWVVRFGSSFATKVHDEQGNPLLQAGLVKRGYWVEVLGSLATNNNAANPGIYINHSMVSYRAPGKEILSGPDPRTVGFGKAPLPAGVTAQPLPGANMPSQVVPGAMPPPSAGAPPPPAVPGSYAPPPGAGAPPPPGAGAPPPTFVQPQPAILAPPTTPAAPAVPPAPTMQAPPSVVDPLGAPMGYRMANPNGANYAGFRAQNWTDAAMLQAGHMVRL
jgi:hypothetical protein